MSSDHPAADTPQPLSLSCEPFSGTTSEWDREVANFDEATFCHLSAWGPIFEDAFGHRMHRWVARDGDGTVCGLLPAVEMTSRLFGKNLISMPFLNYGGPLGSAQARQVLADAAIRRGRDLGVKLVEIRDRHPVHSTGQLSTGKVAVLLPLPDDAETLWTDGLRGKVRSQIRRPMKAEMTAHFGFDLFDEFYAVFSRNMRDLGTPVLGKSLFRAILIHLRENAILCVVRTSQGEPVAAGLGFLYRGEFEITWASSLREYSREAPNMLLYWSLMEEVIRRGGTVFNFGRSTPDTGTHRFKLQWGGHDHQLYWTRWSPNSHASAPPSKDGGLMSKAITVWQRLPLPVANALGPRISRGLPAW